MNRRFRLTFNADKCKGCEICVGVCPRHILELGAEVNANGYHSACCTDESLCVGCASCALMCPDCCIAIYELEEGEV